MKKKTKVEKKNTKKTVKAKNKKVAKPKKEIKTKKTGSKESSKTNRKHLKLSNNSKPAAKTKYKNQHYLLNSNVGNYQALTKSIQKLAKLKLEISESDLLQVFDDLNLEEKQMKTLNI